MISAWFRLDLGWLSLTRILIGFGIDSGLISDGSGLDFGLDFALSLLLLRLLSILAFHMLS